MNTMNGNLPRGDRWTAFDAFSWITFGEVRVAAADFMFPRREWSHDWERWPSGWLSYAFAEIETGIPWTPTPADLEWVNPDHERARARRIMEETGEDPGQLLDALDFDTERYRDNQRRWGQAKADVAEAASTGKLRVWGIKAHGPGKPDKDGTHELLDSWVFEGSRGVDEAGWVDWRLDARGHLDDRGPWYDELRFDAAEVQAMRPALPPAAPGVLPFPEAPHWLAWNAIAWRAFGKLDIPTRITRHRSFDGGTSQLPDESDAAFAARQDEYRRFDNAERGLMDLLAAGRVTAKGRPRATKDGRQLHDAAAPIPKVIPAITFLNRNLAFTPCGDLMISRLPFLERGFDKKWLHGSDADPRFPLYYEVMIEAAELREAWQADDGGTTAPQSVVPSTPSPAQSAVADFDSVTLPPATRKGGGTFSYEKQDAPLIAEMRRLIESGTALSPHKAAWAVVDRAAGRSDGPVSRVARLCAGYKKAHRAVQD